MKKSTKTGLIIAIALISSHFLMDIYKIGMKDGKAIKVTMATTKQLKK